MTDHNHQKEVERSIHILYHLLIQVIEDLDHALCLTTRQRHIREEKDPILSHQEDHVTILDLGPILSQREDQTGIPHQNISHIKRRNLDQDHIHGQDPQESTDETGHFFKQNSNPVYFKAGSLDHFFLSSFVQVYMYIHCINKILSVTDFVFRWYRMTLQKTCTCPEVKSQ